jgi:predicted RNA-binding Zn-ribbon protein involved in translation (DUF1610 family)
MPPEAGKFYSGPPRSHSATRKDPWHDGQPAGYIPTFFPLSKGLANRSSAAKLMFPACGNKRFAFRMERARKISYLYHAIFFGMFPQK